MTHKSQSSSSEKWARLAGVVRTQMTCTIPRAASAVSVCLAPLTHLSWCGAAAVLSEGICLVPRKYLDTSTLIRAAPPQQRDGFVIRKTQSSRVKTVRISREELIMATGSSKGEKGQ